MGQLQKKSKKLALVPKFRIFHVPAKFEIHIWCQKWVFWYLGHRRPDLDLLVIKIPPSRAPLKKRTLDTHLKRLLTVLLFRILSDNMCHDQR